MGAHCTSGPLGTANAEYIFISIYRITRTYYSLHRRSPLIERCLLSHAGALLDEDPTILRRKP